MVCDAHATKLATDTLKPARKLQPRDLPRDWKPTPVTPVGAGSDSVSSYATPTTRPRVVGQSLFGVITSGPLTPEPDYTGMGTPETKIARAEWFIAKRKPG